MVDASIELVFEQVLLGVGGGEGGGNYSTMQVKGRSSSFQHWTGIVGFVFPIQVMW